MSAVEATRVSQCGSCQELIQPGDRIVVVDDEWVHEHCEDEA